MNLVSNNTNRCTCDLPKKEKPKICIAIAEKHGEISAYKKWTTFVVAMVSESFFVYDFFVFSVVLAVAIVWVSLCLGALCGDAKCKIHDSDSISIARNSHVWTKVIR